MNQSSVTTEQEIEAQPLTDETRIEGTEPSVDHEPQEPKIPPEHQEKPEPPSPEPTEDHFKQFSPTTLAPLEPRNLHEAEAVARIFARSGVFKGVNEWEAALVRIMAGRELGFGAFASMNNVYFIEGRTVLGAHLMAAKVRKSEKYDYRIAVHTDQECTIVFFEHGKPLDPPSTFAIADAKKAGVIKEKSAWEKYPRNMLFARAMSNGIRWHCPDLFMFPAYTPEEMGADVDEDGNIITIEGVEFSYKPDDEAGQTGPGRPISKPNPRATLEDPKKNRPPADDTPWHEVIANWTGTNWKDYWKFIQAAITANPAGLGLTSTEAHEALGNPVDPTTGKVSIKGFAGTRGEHNRLMLNASRIKHGMAPLPDPETTEPEEPAEPEAPAKPKGAFKMPPPKAAGDEPPPADKVSMADNEGTLTVSRAIVKANPGKAHTLTIYAMTDAGGEDPLPAIDQPIKAADLRRLFGELAPDKVSEDGTVIFEHDEAVDPPQMLALDWLRDSDGNLSIESVYEL